MKNIAHNDWTGQPGTAMLWWCLPLGLGILASVLLPSPHMVAAAWAAVFAWMGTGCVLNAVRCQRLHCYISGPVLFLGAVAASLIAGGIFTAKLNGIVGATFVLVLLSFVPEMVWRRNLPRKSAN